MVVGPQEPVHLRNVPDWRSTARHHVADTASAAGAQAIAQDDRPLVHDRINQRLEFDEQHRIAAGPDSHGCSIADSNFR